MMTTEIYFQELQSVMTATRLIYHIAYEEVPNEVATEADRCRAAAAKCNKRTPNGAKTNVYGHGVSSSRASLQATWGDL